MPTPHCYRGRRAALVENDELRVTVLEEGGHIAEILDRRSGINALWTPPWPSIEPSSFVDASRQAYGAGPDAKLLAGIMGHNLCVDIFGGPSDEEAAAGLTAHGDASLARYDIVAANGSLSMQAHLPLANLRIERRLDLLGRAIRIRESVENPAACDRPIGWTEHVTLGPPFLEKGQTEFRTSATRSKVYERSFGVDDYLVPAAEFHWPHAPRVGGGTADLRRFTAAAASSAYTAHLMDRSATPAFFAAFSPSLRLVFGYMWKPEDFPWLGIWEENHSRQGIPWNGATLTCGMEFGVSPMPESRRAMIGRGRLFDVPTYRWIPAQSRVEVEYWASFQNADTVPERLDWPA